MTRKVLGRGLSALLSETPAATAANEELREVDIDLIEPNNVQPRTRFDETQLEELAQSIKTNGVVQPILVRKTSGGRYQIVAGERRWRAAEQLGLIDVPVDTNHRLTGAHLHTRCAGRQNVGTGFDREYSETGIKCHRRGLRLQTPDRNFQFNSGDRRPTRRARPHFCH